MLLKFKIQLWVTLFFVLTMAFAGSTRAQTFEEARQYAFNGQREKAREICRAILAEGFNSDVALLLGRTYSWDGEYDSARVVFNKVMIEKPENMEVLSAFADVEYWSENYDKAVEYCDMALQKDSTDEDFVLKKARILYSSEDYEKAVKTLEDHLKIHPGNGEVIKKIKEYRLDLLKNQIKLAYTIDWFDGGFNRDPWQITSLSYGRKTKIGSVIARVNYSDRFGSNGFQYEFDAYPKILEDSYLYVNYGFSQSFLFPKNRFGFEWYQNFPKAFEGSLGLRLLFFDSTPVDIYTATLGKYVGNYWLSLRAFVTPDKTDGTSVSGLMQVRRYFSDPEDYLGLRVGYGVSPDDNSYQRLSLKKRSIRLEFNHIFNHLWVFNTGGVVGQEMNEPGKYLGYYTFDVSIARLF
ncbi:YaiO family outer membrane beta-barrel protein [uncultured Draconibacterium sp.]|uniref:YaiO family outer membrane beta-barrel protein n=1 Tax=uncultured Draconibacterium sp. TaxID=1573823 RepID=UPI0032174C1F